MANRKGVFIGAYVPNELKESLRRRAAAEHRTLSQEITRILPRRFMEESSAGASIDACQTRRLDVAAAILSPVDAEMICPTLRQKASAVRIASLPGRARAGNSIVMRFIIAESDT